jgi:3-phosphoshikimate 1-carboxyvinyltransferase
MIKRVNPGNYLGVIVIPASKSDGQRALLAAALAKGNSKISQLGSSKDELTMLCCIEKLGAKTGMLDGVLDVQGIASFPSELSLHCGESGLALRLLTALCAIHSGRYILNGEGSLLNRSMDFYHTLFLRQKLHYSFSQNNTLPIMLEGKLSGGKISVDGSQSSQYISGLLMALPLLAEDSILEVTNAVSTPYIKMTLNTLGVFGIEIQQDENKYLIRGNQSYQPVKYEVEGDWSSASYWLVASALGQSVSVKGLSMDSLQADKAILNAFELANCKVLDTLNGIRIDGSQRHSFHFDASDCPDLFPALVTLASLTPGISIISGVIRLKNKESDRGKVLQSEFGKLGVQILIIGNDMQIHGKAFVSGGKVSAQHDHRIAMCFGILGMNTFAGIEIDEAEAVAKSYPSFWEDLERCKQVQTKN